MAKVYYISNGYNETLENIRNTSDSAPFDLKSEEEVNSFLENNSDNIQTLVIVGFQNDLQTPFIKYTVNQFLNYGISITCLQVDKDTMVYLFGIYMVVENYVVQPYEKSSLIVNLVGLTSKISNVTTEKRSGTRQQKGDTTFIKIKTFKNNNIRKVSKIFAVPATPIEVATEIKDILASPISTGTEKNKTGGLLKSNQAPNLPEGQMKTYYVKYTDRNPFPNTDSGQFYNNQIVIKVDLIASYDNPPYKYLQLTTLGAGLNPTDGQGMYNNDEFKRGWFQNFIKVQYEPQTDALTVLQTSPKNINNQTTFKTTSDFSVGVNLTTNPGFQGSYKVNTEYDTVISDFNITNNSSGLISEWGYQCSLTRDPWNIFTDRVLVKPTVKELPALATQNLQPTNLVLYYADKNFKDTIRIYFFLTVDYKNARSESAGIGWDTYIDTVDVGPLPQAVYVDFSQVEAK